MLGVSDQVSSEVVDETEAGAFGMCGRVQEVRWSGSPGVGLGRMSSFLDVTANQH